MKRSLLIILMLCVLLTGCNDKKSDENKNSTTSTTSTTSTSSTSTTIINQIDESTTSTSTTIGTTIQQSSTKKTTLSTTITKKTTTSKKTTTTESINQKLEGCWITTTTYGEKLTLIFGKSTISSFIDNKQGYDVFDGYVSDTKKAYGHQFNISNITQSNNQATIKYCNPELVGKCYTANEEPCFSKKIEFINNNKFKLNNDTYERVNCADYISSLNRNVEC